MTVAGPPEPHFSDPVLVGLDDAIRATGVPVLRSALESADLPGPSKRTSGPTSKPRRAEVVLVLPRPSGVLLHTKRFYPRDVYRLPTGGVHAGEPVLEAVGREVAEETGLSLAPTRFLFHIAHVPESDEHPVFHSLGFLLPGSDDLVAPVDDEEEISDFRVIPWSALDGVATQLASLGPPWKRWGRFRSLSHSLLADLWRSERAAFEYDSVDSR